MSDNLHRRHFLGAGAAAVLVVCGRLFHIGDLLQDLQRWFASLGVASWLASSAL